MCLRNSQSFRQKKKKNTTNESRGSGYETNGRRKNWHKQHLCYAYFFDEVNSIDHSHPKKWNKNPIVCSTPINVLSVYLVLWQSQDLMALLFHCDSLIIFMSNEIAAIVCGLKFSMHVNSKSTVTVYTIVGARPLHVPCTHRLWDERTAYCSAKCTKHQQLRSATADSQRQWKMLHMHV